MCVLNDTLYATSSITIKGSNNIQCYNQQTFGWSARDRICPKVYLFFLFGRPCNTRWKLKVMLCAHVTLLLKAVLQLFVHTTWSIPARHSRTANSPCYYPHCWASCSEAAPLHLDTGGRRGCCGWYYNMHLCHHLLNRFDRRRQFEHRYKHQLSTTWSLARNCPTIDFFIW